MTPFLRGISIARLTEELQRTVNRPVIDRTDLPGVYDVTLSYLNESLPPEMRRDSAADGVPLFTALTDQLGLKLESDQGSVEVLVVDHIERPTKN